MHSVLRAPLKPVRTVRAPHRGGISGVSRLCRYEALDIVVEQGDRSEEGQNFFIVDEGDFSVHVRSAVAHRTH